MSEPESDKKKVVIQESALVPQEEKEKSTPSSKKHKEDSGEKKKEETGSSESGQGKVESEKEKESSEANREEKESSEAEKEKEDKGARNISKRHKGDKGDGNGDGDGDGDGDDNDNMSQLLNETIPWNIIDKFFSDNPNVLVAHQLDSYNEFITNGISQIFKEHNPIVFQKEKNQQTDAYKHVSRFYLGGKGGDKIYYGKPVIYDENVSTSRVHYMYPNEARLRNMTYGVTIHYDVEVEFDNIVYEEEESKSSKKSEEVTTSQENVKVKTVTITLPQILLGKFPIMVHSNLCILTGLPKDVIYNLGEDKNDHGGYFIIDGKEKIIVSQEIFADNMLYIQTRSEDDKYIQPH